MHRHVLEGFFSDDPEAVTRAANALSAPGESGPSHGAVTSTDTLRSVPGDERLRADRRGIFSEVIFGPAQDDRCACGATAGEASRGTTCPRCGVRCDRASLRDERWGHLDVVQLVHPSAYRHLGDTLGLMHEELRAVALGEKALRPVKAGKRREPDLGPGAPSLRWDVVPGDSPGTHEHTGPGALSEALRSLDPAHPLLPLCTITKVPVPPPGARPLAPRDRPTQVDPWVGPLNEAWLRLATLGLRERRLLELDAPSIILRGASAVAQRAFEAVVHQTQRASARLVPPLAHVPDDLAEGEALAMAFAGEGRLIVQRRERVLLLDLRGKVLFSLPPAGTLLRGVAQGRFAVFEGFFGATHPALASGDPGFGPDFVSEDEDRVRHTARTLGEISIVDCETGTYLERPPPGLRLTFIGKDQPEDLFLAAEDGTPLRHLRVGGDRPAALAYAPGLEVAWVGEPGCGTEVVELDRGIPHAYPAEPDDDDIPRWNLLSGKKREPDEDEDDEVAASAAAFRDGAWHLLWSNGILCDHRARGAVRLRPAPAAAAFDPGGRTLALLVGGTVILADTVRRKVLRRFPLPAA